MSIELLRERKQIFKISTLMAVITFVVLIGLGTWQLHRLSWKNELVDKIEHNLELPPVQLSVDGSTITEFDFRHVYGRGVFNHDWELYLMPRVLGGRIGVHVLTPFTLDNGLHVLVNRGWVPSSRVDPASRLDGLVGGEFYLAGIVRTPTPENLFTPQNDPDRNTWYWIDIPAMSKATKTPLLPIVIEASNRPNPGGLPIGGQTRLAMSNNHLGYAFTWYALAGVLVVIVAVYRRRRYRPVND